MVDHEDETPTIREAHRAIGELVSSHPGKVAVIFVLLTVLMLIPMSKIEMKSEMSDFVPDNEYGDADLVIREEFNASSTILSMVEADSGDMLDREGLLTLRAMEESVRGNQAIVPYLITHRDCVVTIADVVEAILRAGSNGTAGIAEAPAADLGGAVDAAIRDPASSFLVSDGSGMERDKALVLVLVDRNLHARDLDRGDEDMELEVIGAIGDAAPGGYRVYSMGGWDTEMQRNTQEDMSLLLPVSVVVILVILAISLRSLADLAISSAGLASTLVVSYGLFSLSGLPFNQMTFFAPIMILVLSIDFSIHVLVRFREETGRGDRPPRSMSRALRFIGVAVFLSATTTMAAFASNGFSAIPAVASFGLFLTMGIGVAFLVMMLFVPSLKLLSLRLRSGRTGRAARDIAPSSAGLKKGGARSVNGGGRSRSGNGVRRSGHVNGTGLAARKAGTMAYSHPVMVVMVAMGLTVGAIYLSTLMEKDLAIEDVTAGDSEKVILINALEEDFPGVGMQSVTIVVKGDLTDPAVLRAMDDCVGNMADDRHVASNGNGPMARSILGYVRALSASGAFPADADGDGTSVGDGIAGGDGTTMGSGAADGDGDGLPDTREHSRAALTYLYDNGVPGLASPGDIREILSAGDAPGSFDMALIVVEAYDVEGTRAGELLEEIEDDIGPLEKVGGVTVLLAGAPFERVAMLNAMTDGMMASTMLSILICTAMVVALFGSFRHGLLAAVPVIMVAFWVLGTGYLLGFSLNPVTATTTALTIGIGIDYCIHIVERYRQERRRGRSIEDAMDNTLGNTGKALLLAGVTTASGFVVIAFSRIGMFHMFGVMAFMIIAYTLVASLLVLPAMIVLVDRATGRWSLNHGQERPAKTGK